jgi:hypothetical protein
MMNLRPFEWLNQLTVRMLIGVPAQVARGILPPTSAALN